MPLVGGVALNDRIEGVRVVRWRWLTAPFSLRGLSGFAVWGFVLLSVLATGLGFADLRAAGTDTGELSILELAITIALTLFVVSAMVVALHNMVEPGRAWWTRIVAFVFYLIFAIWSAGFGYGFFASIAVDLGIVFLTLMRVVGRGGGRSGPARGLEKPTPPRLASIFEER
jgi:hypothetical protein